ncbi:MAG: hypothetical protein HYZ59_02790 [Actinobacteria bacterium]|nr:hypothetical protein [Actinomycetota bacterium]
MSNLQLEYTREELLATDAIDEPLVLSDVRCHGGLRSDGSYVTPRTRFRNPAIEAWEQNHLEHFGGEILHAPLETWPRNYPNVEQSKFLLRNGIREPIIANLTRIGTVEGFGAMLGYLGLPDMQRFFVEDIRGTSIDHLSKGLLEAHGRDEGGWEEEAGHKHMWYVVRDIAFEDPLTEDQTEVMMERLGFGGGGAAGAGDVSSARERFMGRRTFEDLDVGLEMLLSMTTRVLFVECKAFHVFNWAQELLADNDLVAGEGRAPELVSYILRDEMPHVGYAQVALTEMRDRTFIGQSGRRYSGEEIIGSLWNAALADSMGVLEDQNRMFVLAEVERALEGKRNGAELLEEFHRLGDIRPGPDGTFGGAAAKVVTY